MTLLQDGLIAFLSAVGLTALVWLVAGAVLQVANLAIGAAIYLPFLRRYERLANERHGGGCAGAAAAPEPPARSTDGAGGLRTD